MKASKIFCISFLFSVTSLTYAQEVTINTTQLSDHIYALEGQGGNIGVSVGNDGVFMIDSQFAPLTPKILEAITSISEKPIHFLVNTHHHGDHTGGNKNINNQGADIIAHENVYKRLSQSSEESPSQPKEALPIITFNDKLTIYMNGEPVLIFHVENAHTDGDALLYFTESNVLHTGDVFFNKRYPFIDLNSGGTIDGYIEAVRKTLILIDDDTKIIPGHGPVSNKEEYKFFLSMLETLKSSVLVEIESGKTEDEVVANTSLTKTYDDLGYSWSFITSEKMRRTLYRGLKK